MGGEGGRTIFPPLDEFYTLKNYLKKNLVTLAPFQRCLFLVFSGNGHFQITSFKNLHKFFSKVISKERLRTTRFNIYKFFSKEISKERLRTSRFKNMHKFFFSTISKERLRTSCFNNLHNIFSKENFKGNSTYIAL